MSKQRETTYQHIAQRPPDFSKVPANYKQTLSRFKTTQIPHLEKTQQKSMQMNQTTKPNNLNKSNKSNNTFNSNKTNNLNNFNNSNKFNKINKTKTQNEMKERNENKERNETKEQNENEDIFTKMKHFLESELYTLKNDTFDKTEIVGEDFLFEQICDDLQREIDEKSKELNLTMKRNKEIEDQIENFENENEELIGQIATKKENVEELKQKQQTIHLESKEYEDKMKIIQNSIEILENEIGEMNETLNEKEEKLWKSEKEKKKLQNEVMDLQGNVRTFLKLNSNDLNQMNIFNQNNNLNNLNVDEMKSEMNNIITTEMELNNNYNNNLNDSFNSSMMKTSFVTNRQNNQMKNKLLANSNPNSFIYSQMNSQIFSQINNQMTIQNNSCTINYGNELKSFTFDNIFGIEERQNTLFDAMKLMIENCLEGQLINIFNYGFDNNMIIGNEDEKGLVELTVSHLLDILTLSQTQMKETNDSKEILEIKQMIRSKNIVLNSITIKCLEIINERVFDISNKINQNEILVQSSNNTIELVNCKDIGIQQQKDIDDLFINITEHINQMKHSNESKMILDNSDDMKESIQRVFIIDVNGIKTTPFGKEVFNGVISFIDIPNEMNMNKSVFDKLTQIYSSIAEQMNPIGNIPGTVSGNILGNNNGNNGGNSPNKMMSYDEVVITKILQKSLIGNSKNLFIVNVSLNEEDVIENINCLQYSQLVRKYIVSNGKKK